MNNNPWGVSLKSRAKPKVAAITHISPEQKGEDPLAGRLEDIRMKLRRVQANVKPKAKQVDSTDKKSSLRHVENNDDLFTLQKNPVFGVVLRSRGTDGNNKSSSEEETLSAPPLHHLGEFLDLDFRADGEATGSEGPSEKSVSKNNSDSSDDSSEAPFGVRLKKTGRQYGSKDLPRTYQIDLNPPEGLLPGSKYEASSPYNFLEIKLKPIKRNAVSKKKHRVKLELRHVVIPEDGSRRHTVTEASFNLKNLPLDQLQRRALGKGQQGSNSKKGKKQKYGYKLDDLMQLAIERLRPASPQQYTPAEHHGVCVNLRHVECRNSAPLVSHTIDAKLRKVLLPRSDDRAIHPSMEVKLRKAPRDGKPNDSEFRPEFLDVELNHVVAKEKESEYDDDEDVYFEEAEEELKLQDLIESSEEPEESQDLVEPQNMRSSLPDLHLDKLNVLEDESDQNDEISDEESSEEAEELVESETDYKKPPQKEEEAVKKEEAKRETHVAATEGGRKPPRRQRSSSLSHVDRVANELKRSGEDDIVGQKEKKLELTNKKGRDLLMWYNRMRCPDKENMKRRVAQLPPSCDITPEDVELLPWLCKGRYLDIRAMNKFFMEQWQGAEKASD